MTPAADAPHVLFLGHGAERTGPPILLGHLLRGLAASGTYRASVLTERSGPLLAEYRATGASARAATTGREPLEPLAAGLRRLGVGRALDPLQQASRSRRARPLGPPDLVWVNGATPATAALLRATDPSPATPVILQVHELDVGLRLTLDPADLAFLLERADHIVAVSDPVAELLATGHDVDPTRITTCPGFIDVAAVRPGPHREVRARLAIPDDAPVVGSVGLPDWRKDPERLLHAMVALRTTHPALDPWVVWVGGDPSSVDGGHLADEARRVGLHHRFVHVAHTDRPDALLGALDVFALPAREDAFPLAALEAGAASLPLVCFRTGGIAGLADRGAGTAVAYPDVAAFGEALVALLLDPRERARVGARSRELVVAQHDLGVGVDRLLAVLAHALGKPSRT